ncbi:MAG: DUF2064 domain-containing protein [Propionibacteriales bacterium]|nr:DUF2064 domain-containing protein [Propionibacteriales bacterium]
MSPATSTTARVLVMAKAPVPGHVKTRLGADVGMTVAADLAAAALLDTLEVCTATFGTRYLALAGDLALAARSDAIVEALAGWIVFEQEGSTFAERLAHAHARVADCGPGPVVQVGMDTPQLTAELLGAVTDGLVGADVVLGPAPDGGWWVLGLADGRDARVLVDVPMSVPQTYRRTVDAFAGHRIADTVELCDVDTVADAEQVAALAPGSRFAHAWASGLVVSR